MQPWVTSGIEITQCHRYRGWNLVLEKKLARVHTQCQWRMNPWHTIKLAQVLEIQLLERKSWRSYNTNLVINMRDTWAIQGSQGGKILGMTWFKLMAGRPMNRAEVDVFYQGHVQRYRGRWTGQSPSEVNTLYQDFFATAFYRRPAGQKWMNEEEFAVYTHQAQTQPQTMAMIEKEPRGKLSLIVWMCYKMRMSEKRWKTRSTKTVDTCGNI